jgi:arsenite methyltransferase
MSGGNGERDKWAAWVLERSYGGDPQQKQRWLDYLEPVRDRILEHARLKDGDVLLDVGTGDGLVAFGAVPFVGSGHVIFSDVSADLLDACRTAADALDVADRARFIQASADNLSPVPGDSVDVVTTRSVLIYVDDKADAFNEFHRVLRPGGRISIFEPINNYFPWDSREFWGFDSGPVRDLVEKIWSFQGWANEEEDARDPMMNFDDRDLVRLAEDAGFAEVHLELVVDVGPGSWVDDWEVMLQIAPNPNAQTLGESIKGALSTTEAARLESHLRPQVDAGAWIERMAVAYLWARK